MTNPGETTYEDKVSILAELWLDYRDEDAFTSLFEYSDLAFPLAFALHHQIIERNDRVDGFISETFDLLCDTLGIEEDAGYSNLDEMMIDAQEGIE